MIYSKEVMILRVPILLRYTKDKRLLITYDIQQITKECADPVKAPIDIMIIPPSGAPPVGPKLFRCRSARAISVRLWVKTLESSPFGAECCRTHPLRGSCTVVLQGLLQCSFGSTSAVALVRVLHCRAARASFMSTVSCLKARSSADARQGLFWCSVRITYECYLTGHDPVKNKKI